MQQIASANDPKGMPVSVERLGDPTYRPDWLQIPKWSINADQIWDVWIKPELQRRISSGELSSDLDVWVMQVLFKPEGGSLVRFNREVNGEFVFRPLVLSESENYDLHRNLRRAERFDLSDDVIDHGHITIIYSEDHWRTFWNAQTGRGKAREYLDLTTEFLQAAANSAARQQAGPAVDNLYSAAELSAKACLILDRSEFAFRRTHKSVTEGINRKDRINSADPGFLKVLNKLAQQRPGARYLEGGARPSIPTEDFFHLVEASIRKGSDRVTKSTERNLI